MNCPGETSICSWRLSSIQRSSSVFPPPLVTKIYGLRMKLVCASREREAKCLHLYPIWIAPIDVFHRIDRYWKRLPSFHENAINIKGDREFVCTAAVWLFNLGGAPVGGRFIDAFPGSFQPRGHSVCVVRCLHIFGRSDHDWTAVQIASPSVGGG